MKGIADLRKLVLVLFLVLLVGCASVLTIRQLPPAEGFLRYPIVQELWKVATTGWHGIRSVSAFNHESGALTTIFFHTEKAPFDADVVLMIVNPNVGSMIVGEFRGDRVRTVMSQVLDIQPNGDTDFMIGGMTIWEHEDDITVLMNDAGFVRVLQAILDNPLRTEEAIKIFLHYYNLVTPAVQWTSEVEKRLQDLSRNGDLISKCAEMYDATFGPILVIEAVVDKDTTYYLIISQDRAVTQIEVELPGNVCDQWVDGISVDPATGEFSIFGWHHIVHRDEYVTDGPSTGPRIEEFDREDIWDKVFGYLMVACNSVEV